MSDEEVRFECPECGSHYWGTSNVDKDNAVGHCHGEYIACTFSWPRTEDDKYFKVPERMYTEQQVVEKLNNNCEDVRITIWEKVGSEYKWVDGSTDEVMDKLGGGWC